MQTNSLLKKGCAVGIILLFIGTAIIPSSGQKIEKLSSRGGHWLYVGGSGPGNYTKIQDAINNATDGDTVFVYDDSSPYKENIFIDHSIRLLGENQSTTIINGSYRDVVRIEASNVTLQSFTIMKSGYQNIGLLINSSNNFISNVNFSDNDYGIQLYGISGTIITESVFFSDSEGIFCGAMQNTISHNTFNNCGKAIEIDGNQNNIIYNVVNDCTEGLLVSYHYGNVVKNNIIQRIKDTGMYLYEANNTVIENNTIKRMNYYDITNRWGIDLHYSPQTRIVRNAFVNCGLEVNEEDKLTVLENTVNGKPLVYLENEADKAITTSAGQILCLMCHNISFTNQYINDTRPGVVLLDSYDINIENSTFENNEPNINEYSCQGITIQNSTFIAGPAQQGFLGYFIDVEDCYDDTYANNEFRGGNFYAQLLFHFGGHMVFTGNKFIDLHADIMFDLIRASTLSTNHFSNGSYLHFTLSSRNKIVQNIFQGASTGIALVDSSHNQIMDNVFSNVTGIDAIGVTFSFFNKIKHNSIEHCSSGVNLFFSQMNGITENNFIDCDTMAFFASSRFNHWGRNYWGKPHILPLKIYGEIWIPYFNGYNIDYKKIPTAAFDWHPAQKPYNITGMS
jgi:parallel beta-helix repeat protein